MYQCARQDPNRFFIGIDANSLPLEKISEKVHRKPAKGGAPNILFVQAAVEDLPFELDGVANEVNVLFPWGSLLRAVAAGDAAVLRNLRKICSPAALLKIVIGLSPERDRSEIARLGLGPLSNEFIETVLTSRYRSAGFEIIEKRVLAAPEYTTLQTSWAKRLMGNADRSLICITALTTQEDTV